MYFNSWKEEGFICDLVQDIKLLNDTALKAKKSGQIILGGGVIKHHICNANLMRNGANFSVFVNTGQEFDGSDSGAKPDEAISWGKIAADAKPVKLYAECSLVLPIIIGESFVRNFELAKRT
jgi:deoxyhypusine synthase